MPSDIHEMDRALVEACAGGEAAAWERFIASYGKLIRAAVARTGLAFQLTEAELDDLVSHVYEKLLEDQCRRMRLWRGRAKLSTYLVQVVKNLVLDHCDARARRPRAVSLEHAAETAATSNDIAEDEWRDDQIAALRAAIDALPPRQAAIVRLRMDGVSLRDIATTLGRPSGTIAVENSRALEKLRVALQAWKPEVPLERKTCDAQLP